jgi:hypothetical protein
MRLKLIIAGRADGLGSRFKNILVTKALADFLKVSYLICWNITSSHCKCPMEYLIDEGTDYVNTVTKLPDITNTNLIDCIKEKYDIDLPHSKILYPGKSPIIVTKEITDDYDVLVLYSNGFYRYETEYKNIDEKMMISFNRFILNQYVQEQINKFKRKYFCKYKVIGIHIRRGECEHAGSTKIHKRGNVPLDSVYKILDLGLFKKDNYLYFICSDDQTVIDTINEKYQRPVLKHGIPIKNSSKTFHYPCRSLDRSDPLAIQDAWIIMNLMRMCSLIICSHSLFNKVPCFVSDTYRCLVSNNMKKTWNNFNKIRKTMKL